jgi:hypothetical protein
MADGERVRVQGIGPDAATVFTIECRVARGWPSFVRGYGCIPDGRKRVGKRGHLMLTDMQLREWAVGLVEVTSGYGRKVA